MSAAIDEDRRRLDGITLFVQPGWWARYPRLIQGITGRGLDFGRRTAGDGVWQELAAATGLSSLVRCSQVHGASVVTCDDVSRDRVRTVGDGDALVTRRPDLVLAIGVADCVPVFLIEPAAGVLGLAHAGWRGIAAGVVEATLQAMRDLGAGPGRIRAHLGPAICGRCYEVGPEVPAALGLGGELGRVDLRGCVVERAVGQGVSREAISVSGRCTRCDRDRFYSYRGGDWTGRMSAILGGSCGEAGRSSAAGARGGPRG